MTMPADDPTTGIPRDLAAEQAAVGSMMLSPSALATCLEMLQPDMFSRPAHQEIFAAIKAMADRGEPVDAITVNAELGHRGTIRQAGGGDYLHDLIAIVPVTASAGHYAGRVRECAIRWRLAEAGERIRQAALGGGADLADRVEAAYRVVDEATATVAPAGARSIADLIGPVIDELQRGAGQSPGLPSGWADLDDLIVGMRGGQMVAIGGRPACGKSTVMLNMAAHAGISLGVPGLFCTLEMSSQECVERILAARGTVDLRKIRSRTLDDRDWDRISKVHGHLTPCGSLMFNDDQYMSVQSIRTDLREMRRAGHPAGFVVVDHIGLVCGSQGKTENRQQEVSEFSRGLKRLAKEFDVPVIAGSQLNRGPELRSDHTPMLADLRESGSIEQDSDIVILLYREDAYERESPRAGEIDLIVAKNRQGRQGVATLAFRGHYAMCGDMYRPSADETTRFRADTEDAA